MSQYFYAKGKEKVGPVSLEELKRQKLNPDNLVWKTGLPEWMPAKQLEELKDMFLVTPPPLPIGNNLKKDFAKGVLLYQDVAFYAGIMAIVVTITCLFIFQPLKFDGEEFQNYKGVSNGSYSFDITKPVYTNIKWSEGFGDYCDDKVGFDPYYPQLSYAERKEYLIWKAIRYGIYAFLLCIAGFSIYKYIPRAQVWLEKNAG